MEKQVIQTSDNPKVTILRVDGDLILKGWDEAQVVVKSDSADALNIEQGENEVQISTPGHCTLRVPFGASVQANRVSGHATIKSLDGPLAIEEISGDLTLRAVGPVRVSQVNGHLAAKNVSGDFWARHVDGDVTVRDIQGDFTIEDIINSHLTLKDIGGNASASANGDITLSFDPEPGNTYRFSANGNLLCRLPEDASAEVEIAQASRIVIKFTGVEKTTLSQPQYRLTLGEGAASLTLSAGGDVILSSQPPDWEVRDIDLDLGEDFESMAETISQQVTQQIESQMEMLEHQLQSQLENLSTAFRSAGLPAEQAERMAQRAHEARQRAQARAEEKLRRAQEKLQRKLEAARRRAEQRARAAERAARDRRRRTEGFPRPPAQPEPFSEPVTDEERMMILQMLEQNKITVEEAEQLLAALEGKSG